MLRADDVIARVTCAPLQVNNITEMLNGLVGSLQMHLALHMKHNPPLRLDKVTAIVQRYSFIDAIVNLRLLISVHANLLCVLHGQDC